METIKLTADQIKTIKNALLYIHDKKLDFIKQNYRILSDKEREVILERANEYYDIIEDLTGQTQILVSE